MGTPHIEAAIGDIAEVVLMPGDPLRAKMISEKYLTEVKQINKVRNMFGYTGYYKGKRVTVMGSGMGMPSMGIYSYELYNFYNVKKIIRIGTFGAYKEELKVLDLVLVDHAYSETNYAYSTSNFKESVIEASKELTEQIENKSKELNMKIRKGTIMSSDSFYSPTPEDIWNRIPKELDVLGVEMEAFALFHNAKILGKEAACLVTVSDNLKTKQEISSEAREKSLFEMIELALESV